MLKFDEDIARQLDEGYKGADFAERRRANFDALRPVSGQALLDIGCGNGMLAEDLARAVGPDGQVIALDPSEDMRKRAAARLTGMDWAEAMAGSVSSLPLEDQSQDGAVSVQVFEYIEDLPQAVSEVARVLKPGGAFVIGDQHFDSFAWYSDDPARMQRMLDAWDHHFVHRDIPAILPNHLRKAGFEVETVQPVPCTDHVRRPNGLARLLTILMHAFAIQNSLMGQAEADAWRDEQTQLAADGRFFFCLTHYVIRARKL